MAKTTLYSSSTDLNLFNIYILQGVTITDNYNFLNFLVQT